MPEPRWRIHGALHVQSPLHVGLGDRDDAAGARRRDGRGTDAGPRVADVRRDESGRPYVPATALRGALRAWLVARASVASKEVVERVFGSLDAPDDASHGGRAYFYDAFATDPAVVTSDHTGVGIHRRTGAADAEMGLLYTETRVPAGTRFAVEIAAEGLAEPEIVALLQALEGFNASSQPLGLGSGRGNGLGRCAWMLKGIDHLDTSVESRKRWVASATATDGIRPAGFHGLPPVAAGTLAALRRQAVEPAPGARFLLRLDVLLEFDAPLIVRDPQREDADDASVSLPAVDATGHPRIPASSARGALRSQAERIVRTLEPSAALPLGARRAPLADGPKPQASLCLADQVFGTAGWASPVEVSDFVARTSADAGVRLRQRSVAIDRFTGGAADRRLFALEAFDRARLAGRIDLDLQRMTPEALGLWVLLVRDLVEGDVGFGAGSRRGFGRCTASIHASVEGPPPTDGWVAAALGDLAIQLPDARAPHPIPRDAEPLPRLLQGWVQALRARLATSGGGAA